MKNPGLIRVHPAVFHNVQRSAETIVRGMEKSTGHRVVVTSRGAFLWRPMPKCGVNR